MTGTTTKCPIYISGFTLLFVDLPSLLMHCYHMRVFFGSENKQQLDSAFIKHIPLLQWLIRTLTWLSNTFFQRGKKMTYIKFTESTKWTLLFNTLRHFHLTFEGHFFCSFAWKLVGILSAQMSPEVLSLQHGNIFMDLLTYCLSSDEMFWCRPWKKKQTKTFLLRDSVILRQVKLIKPVRKTQFGVWSNKM